MSEITTRLATPEDIPFIKKTWLYSYYNGNSEMQSIDKDTFMREHSKVITEILTAPSTFVHVACLTEDPSIVVAFAAVSRLDIGNVLHFMYTKKLWRGNKIHELIVPEKIHYYTHRTRQFLKIKSNELKYNPYLRGK